jgi:hypothetical protein
MAATKPTIPPGTDERTPRTYNCNRCEEGRHADTATAMITHSVPVPHLWIHESAAVISTTRTNP